MVGLAQMVRASDCGSIPISHPIKQLQRDTASWEPELRKRFDPDIPPHVRV